VVLLGLDAALVDAGLTASPPIAGKQDNDSHGLLRVEGAHPRIFCDVVNLPH